jgi:hypothetical protein
MFVPEEFQKTQSYVMTQIAPLEKIEWMHLLMSDYAFHSEDSDYDGGLSFFDRLNKKLGHFHESWDIDGFKSVVRNANDPPSVYMDILKYMLEDPNHVVYYGL